MFSQTAVVIVEPGKANLVLADLCQVKAEVVSVSPIRMGYITGCDDLLITFRVEAESEDAQIASLTWVEDTLGPNCKVF